MKRKRIIAGIIFTIMLICSIFVFNACKTETKDVSVTFKSDGEIYATLDLKGTEAIAFPKAPEKEGYTFDGWYLDAGEWNKPFTEKTLEKSLPTENTTVYAKFSAVSYNVTYVVNGGTHNNPESYTVQDNITLNDAEKDGYSFEGWYSDKLYENKVTSLEKTTGNLTLYAKFALKHYEIAYNGLNGAVNDNPISYTIESEDIILKSLELKGYVFEGWYKGDTKITKISKGSFGDLILTAKWSFQAYKINYHNIADSENPNQNKYNITELPFTLKNGVRSGYTFLGWYKTSACTDKIETITEVYEDGIDLYAKWKVNEYTATFKADGKTVSEVKFTIESSVITEPDVPEKTGYTGKWESYTLKAENITINAEYTAIKYNIVYHNVSGASHSNPLTYSIEDKSFALTEASKSGYVFIGWFADEECTSKVNTIDTKLLKDVNIYAKWELIEYTATFKADGKVVGEVEFTIEDEAITEPDIPEKAGYIGKWESYTIKAEDITVNAEYTAIEYFATFKADGKVVGKVKFTIEDETITEPDVPEKVGYIGKWESYTFKAEDITINAEYTAIEYFATFKADGKVVGKVKFTIEDEAITEPVVPKKSGYTGKWKSYTLKAENITINAVYSLVTYTITYHNVKGATNDNRTSYTVENNNFKLSPLSLLGYKFDGWYFDETLKSEMTEILTMNAVSIHLYAKWELISYKITYIWDESIGAYKDGESNPSTYTIEDEIVFNILESKNKGYKSLGWYTAKNEGDGEKLEKLARGSTGELTLYAHWSLENYTITYYNADGVENTNATSYNIESEDITIFALSKIGYEFDGWYSDEEFKNKASVVIKKGSTGDLSYYAKWTAIKYEIEYVKYGGSYADEENPDTYTIEDEIELLPLLHDKFVFDGWFTLPDGGERVERIARNSTGKKVLYAHWKKVITFESNGGSLVVSMVESAGAKINEPPVPTKEGYAFAGWYSDVGLTERFVFDKMPNKNITLYAKWTAADYTITYVLNGGTNNVNNVNGYNTEQNVTLYAPSKTGYTFVGWFKDKDFTSEAVTEIKKGSRGNVTFYANFKINAYTISFESNGGTSVSAIEQNYGTAVTEPSAPAKNGYKFDGWYKEESLKTKYVFDTMPAENITVYAKWSTVTYNIAYILNGGTNDKNNVSGYTIEQTVTLYAPVKDGYNFAGWFTDGNYSDRITEIAKGSFGDLELFAKWEVITYKIEYVTASGAKHENPVGYTAETDLYKLKNAVLKGYTFNGWFKESEYINRVTIIGGGEIGDKVLYAKFTVNTYNLFIDGTEESVYTVAFDLNGASGTVATQSVSEYNPLQYPAVPERNGYLFGGWYDNRDCEGSLYDFTAQITKDVTLYAKWFELGSAAAVNVNKTATVNINGKQERVLMFVPLVSGNVTITTTGNLDTFGILKNVGGVILAQDDDSGNGDNFQIIYNVTAGKPYYIVIRSFGTVKGSATLSITGKTEVADGGFVVTPTKSRVTFDAEFSVDVPAARDGYTFLGYADKDGKFYTDRTGKSIIKWDKDEDSVLYSVWEKAVYTVTFNTSGGSEISPVTLPYGARLDINEYVTTRANYSFDCWYLGDEIFEATTMPDHNITLEAAWKKYSVGTIKLDESKTAISYKDTVTAELFGVYAVDTDGKYVDFTITVNNVAAKDYTLTAGETVTVKFVAGNKQRTIEAKVYGEPVLDYTYSDYVNVPDGLVASSFKASGKDTFGNATSVRVSVIGEYEAGTYGDILIEAIDAAGNVTSATLKNVKLYGKPIITYNTDKTAIKETDTINAELFGATAKDSFGNPLTVSVTKYSGTQAAGNSITVKFTVTDSKGNVNTFTISGIKVYGVPVISDATKTEFKEDTRDIISLKTLGVTAKDSFGNQPAMSLMPQSETRVGGDTIVYTVTATDAAGNVTTKDISVKIYGAPVITVGRTSIKTTEDPTKAPGALKATAKDSFGNALSVTVTLKSGAVIGGNEVVYTVTATDKLGNTASADKSVRVYSVDEIKLSYSKRASDMIKLNSKGEEFFASAKDSFGEACDITVEAASGYTLAAGKEIGIYLVATDKAGNSVRSDLIEKIKIYGMPEIEFSSHYIYEETIIETYFTIKDSFGDELSFTIDISGSQSVGNTLSVVIKAQDDVGNILDETIELYVIENYQSPVEYGGLTYTLNADKTAYTVTAYDGITETVTILDFIGKFPVTKIGSSVFKNKTTLKRIAIGDQISAIYDGTFYGCTELKYNEYNNAYYLGNDINKYLVLIKAKSTDIVSCILNDHCKFIYGSAFYGCGYLKNIIIPNSVTSIGSSAFYECVRLKKVTIGNNVTSIKEKAFATRSWITEGSVDVNYCGTIDQWAEINFSHEDSNPLNMSNKPYKSYLYINNKLVTTINLVVATKISAYAFYCCDSLKSVSIGSSVTSIDRKAFSYCRSLTNVKIPDSVTSIGEFAFESCGNLTNIKIPDSVTSIDNYSFRGCSSLTSVEIGNGVTSIRMFVFSGCSSLTSITIPDSVTAIDYGAFSGCSSLINITIPNNVDSIGQSAFSDCSSLTIITIPNSVTSIGWNAFYKCSALTSITIPDSVTYIGNYAFSGCSSLTSVTFENPNGWYVRSSSATSGTNLTLKDKAQNAKYLTNTYDDYYWKRK